jgi:hypothetical protein
VELFLNSPNMPSWRGDQLKQRDNFTFYILGAHPTPFPMGTRALSLWVKRPEREADHSPPSSAEVKE